MITIQKEINNMTALLDEQDELIEQIKTVAIIKPMTTEQAVKQAVETQGYVFDDETSYINTGGVRRMFFIHPTEMKEIRISVEESMI